MKLNREQQAALDELCETFVRLRATADTYGNNYDTTVAAKALWTDVTALIQQLDPDWKVRGALVAAQHAEMRDLATKLQQSDTHGSVRRLATLVLDALPKEAT